jgi:hypothetical protein
VTAVVLAGRRESLAVDEVRRRLHPLDGCAGTTFPSGGPRQRLRIEGRGQALVATLEGDRTSVLGLPTLVVVRLLRARGFPVL